MRPLLAFVAALLAAGCSAQPTVAPTKPDPALKQFRSLAYLPFYGEPADPTLQNSLAKRWEKTWNEVHEKTVWITPADVISMHFSEDLLLDWSKNEKRFIQTGRFSQETVERICASVRTDAVMQAVIFAAVGGEQGSLIRLITPFAGQQSKSTANLSLTIYSCKPGYQVWHAAETVEWTGYTRTQMIEYTQDRLARVLLW